MTIQQATPLSTLNHMPMGFGWVFVATPVVKSASSWLKHYNFQEGASFEVAQLDLEPLSLECCSWTVVFKRFF
jgi:hypothetical protein